MNGFTALLELTPAVFSAPGFAIFVDLIAGWALAPGRRTVTAMVTVADPAGRRAHDAYHRFLRDGAWVMSRLWQPLATHAIARFPPTEWFRWTATTPCSTRPVATSRGGDGP